MLGLNTPNDREKELADIPVVGTLFQRGGQASGSPKSVDDFYDRLEHALKVHRSKEHPEAPQDRAARIMLTDAYRAIQALWAVEKASQSIEERREIRRQITRPQFGNPVRCQFDLPGTNNAPSGAGVRAR